MPLREHRVSFEIRGHKMESSSPQSMLYRYGTQGYPGGFHSFQEGKHGNFRAKGFAMKTYRVSPWETASRISSSLSSKKRKASIAMPETGFDTRSMGYGGNFNELLDFSAGSSFMLPPRKRPVIWVDQRLKGNDTLSSVPMQVAMGICPSMFNNFQAQLAPDELMQSEFSGFLDPDDIGSWSEGFPMPVNDPWPIYPAGSYPYPSETINVIKFETVTRSVPLNSGDGHADHFPDRGFLDVPQWVQEPPVSLATSMQDYFPDTHLDESLPSYDLYSPFQIGEPWDLSLQEDMGDSSLPSIPSNNCLDYSILASNSPLANRNDSIPTNSDRNTSSSVLEPAKAPELRIILPRPQFLPSYANSDDITQEGSAKLGRRRNLTTDEKEAAARVRKIGSCARCIVRKIRVSS
jgi:hypothetical protein